MHCFLGHSPEWSLLFCCRRLVSYYLEQRILKFVKNLVTMTAGGENCILATRTEEADTQYALTLCNTIGLLFIDFLFMYSKY